jgi:hypothetical protein
MKDLQREILNQVASGEITAGEAAARLEALDSAPAEPAPASLPPAPTPMLGTATRVVKVISVLGSATVVGDPSVAVAVADGPHRARQDGDMLVIEHAPFDENGTFVFSGGRHVVTGPDPQRRNLSVRMNPSLPLFANVQAGNVNVMGVRGPITAQVQAGNCRVEDFQGALDLMVQAGNVNATGRLDSGASKIRCEMGSVKMNLGKGSSVRITARSTMGKVAVDGGATTKMGSGDSIREVTIGLGAGTLDVECTMGSVKVLAE